MSPKFLIWQVSKSRSARLHSMCNLQDRKSFLRFFHLSSLISRFLYHDEGGVFFICSSTFFDFRCFAAAQIFATAFHFASAVFFAAVQFFATAHRFASAVSFAAAAVLFYSSKLRILSGTSPSTFRSLCLPPSLPFESSFSLIVVSMSPPPRLMQCGKSPSACLSFCLQPPSRFLLSSL